MKYNLTIRDAANLYKSYGKELSRNFDNFIQLGRTSAIPNDYSGTGGSYLHSLIYVGLILSKTQKFLRMVVGNSCDLLFDALEAEFRETVERIKMNNGFVKIVLVNGHSDFLEKIVTEYAGTISLIYSNTDMPVMHFITSDSYMLREEEPHQPLTTDSSSDLIKAKVYFSNKKSTKATEELFDSLWKHLTKE